MARFGEAPTTNVISLTVKEETIPFVGAGKRNASIPLDYQ